MVEHEGLNSLYLRHAVDVSVDCFGGERNERKSYLIPDQRSHWDRTVSPHLSCPHQSIIS